MSYREFAPPVQWQNVIECVWTRTPHSGAIHETTAGPATSEPNRSHVILPDGAMDVIATFHPDGSLDDAFVVGAMTEPHHTTLSPQLLVGIRFFPGAGGGALRANALQLADQHAALADVCSRGSGVRDALQALASAPQSALALHAFATQLEIRRDATPALVREAARLLARPTRPMRVQAVASALRVSRQHLTRAFGEHSGLTPKQFAQICRVRALLSLARLAGPKWSFLAAEFGYADQSHLIADVRAVTGLTPGEWRSAPGSNFPIAPVPVAAS